MSPSERTAKDAAPLAPDPALSSACALAREVGWELGHQQTVARLSLALFDELAGMHVMGSRARLLLACAAHVHDIGFAHGQPRHHKTSESMIRDAGIDGLESGELEMVAAIARYHRKALPSMAHSTYAALAEADRRTVRWCAALLRVADGLDRAHDDGVTEVRTRVKDDEIVITISPSACDEADLWGARRKVDLLEAESGRRVSVRRRRGTRGA